LPQPSTREAGLCAYLLRAPCAQSSKLLRPPDGVGYGGLPAPSRCPLLQLTPRSTLRGSAHRAGADRTKTQGTLCTGTCAQQHCDPAHPPQSHSCPTRCVPASHRYSQTPVNQPSGTRWRNREPSPLKRAARLIRVDELAISRCLRGHVPAVCPIFASKYAVCVNQKAGENFEVRNICLLKQDSDSEPFG